MNFRPVFEAIGAMLLSGAALADGSIQPGETLGGVSVLGTASIYDIFGHAGNPGGDYGPDSPAILISFGPSGSSVFTFSATGLVSCCSDAPNIPPDGGNSATSIVGANGLSSISGNSNIPLVGVFTTSTDPFGSSAPAALNFDANAPTSLAPLLNQVFYIGDGRTGRSNASGSFLNFIAPSTATRLYLGVIDAFGFNAVTGYYNDNKGSFSVDVNLAAVPEPETYALMLCGLALLGFIARRRTRAVA